MVVDVRATPARAVRGTFLVRCYAHEGSDIRTRDLNLTGAPPIRKSVAPTIPASDYCQVDGQLSYAGNGGRGNIELTVLGR